MINAFSSTPNLNTKSSLEDKALRSYYKIMKVFLLKFLIIKKSQNCVMFNFFILTHIWANDILFEKLTPDTGW